MSKKSDLTLKEIEILSFMARGYLNKQIAASFNTTEQTIKNYISRIFLKLNAANRTEAVTKAVYNGLISLDITGND